MSVVGGGRCGYIILAVIAHYTIAHICTLNVTHHCTQYIYITFARVTPQERGASGGHLDN